MPSSPSRAPAAPPRATADRRALDHAIRNIPIAWFRASPAIYWTDLLISSAIGWTAFVFAVRAHGAARAGLLLVVVFAMYRAVLFIHEITHRARRDVPGLMVVWNIIVGIPLLIPSFLYEGVHTDHHRQASYGTSADPEYLPFGRRPPSLIVVSLLMSLLAPVLFVLRFGVLAPLSWLVPPMRRTLLARASALVINHRYVRRTPIGSSGVVEEAAACAGVWAAAWLWAVGLLPTAAIGCWTVMGSVASSVNAIRTLTSHRYGYDEDDLSMTDQLLDSCTIDGNMRDGGRLAGACRALVAPVGLRYHALHHWIPSLPYHNLGRTHRLLIGALAPDAPYRATIDAGFLSVLSGLARRSREHVRRT